MFSKIISFIYSEAEKVRQEEKERKANQNEKASGSIKDLIDLKNLKEGFSAVFCKVREHNGRLLLLLLILAFELEMFSAKGIWSSSYLYMRKVLKFDAIQFSRFISISGIINLGGNYIVVPFLSKKLKWSDSAIALTGN